jgi:uncharacterized protein
VDSAFLWSVANEVLGDKVLAATAISPSLASRETELVKKLVGEIGGRHQFVITDELEDIRYAKNPANRCYYCKTGLWTVLSALAADEGLETLVDGCNLDDVGDHRPGQLAGGEFEVRSPLRENGFTKADIRMGARLEGLSVWDKPAMACLASRFEYGVAITRDGLARVDRAEEFLREFCDGPLRVRVHGDHLARIEVSHSDLDVVLSRRERIAADFRRLGFLYVTLDVEGFRSGSMNATLETSGDRR